MKKKSLGPYVIAGAVVTVLAILCIPFAETLYYPGTTYAQGFREISTYLIAVGVGISLAVFLYRGDQKKKGAASPAEESLPDKEDPGEKA